MPRPSSPARAYLGTLIVGLTLTTPAAYPQLKWVMPALSPEPTEGETGRRYSVVEFKAALIWHFGKPK